MYVKCPCLQIRVCEFIHSVFSIKKLKLKAHNLSHFKIRLPKSFHLFRCAARPPRALCCSSWIPVARMSLFPAKKIKKPLIKSQASTQFLQYAREFYHFSMQHWLRKLRKKINCPSLGHQNIIFDRYSYSPTICDPHLLPSGMKIPGVYCKVLHPLLDFAHETPRSLHLIPKWWLCCMLENRSWFFSSLWWFQSD